MSSERIAHLTQQVDLSFPDARVDNYAELAGQITNHPKDRHVVAAAVKSGASLIVTYNLKDFSVSALSTWKIEARHPDEFLTDLWKIDRDRVVSRLRAQAVTIGRTLPELLRTLDGLVPGFSSLIR